MLVNNSLFMTCTGYDLYVDQIAINVDSMLFFIILDEREFADAHGRLSAKIRISCQQNPETKLERHS